MKYINFDKLLNTIFQPFQPPVNPKYRRKYRTGFYSGYPYWTVQAACKAGLYPDNLLLFSPIGLGDQRRYVRYSIRISL